MPLRPDGHRDFVLVNQTLWVHYWQRWRGIDREWRSSFSKESIGTVGYVIAAAREQLRAEIRQMAPHFQPNDTDERGIYLIPV